MQGIFFYLIPFSSLLIDVSIFQIKQMIMLELTRKLEFLYPTYVLAIVSIGYICGELGHYLIGVTSKAVAQDLHYGDISCQLNLTDVGGPCSL
ncbi:unnamed protein product [Acanthoscelides obtectus]|uniref:Uncharacterized protein n=1 Tax=Acanthoscelides obtectus TaxID=200917 RepID=A0A9P0KAD8_ACAOB|nr:unnamed protein product [Acanthoscelides obtectus]CAK1662579.1 hypothetical protein AOBTE_LOCUS23219 [Acanthoscelides obtectus]